MICVISLPDRPIILEEGLPVYKERKKKKTQCQAVIIVSFQLQDLPSSGATAAVFFTAPSSVSYLVVANSLDNAGTSQVSSDIWRWDPVNKRFTQQSSLLTLGASALTVFTISDKLYLAVANKYDSIQKSYQVE